jgi:hypothetical protein
MEAHPTREWVLINVLETKLGYSDDAVRAKVKRNVWKLGTHWRKAPDGRLVFDLTAIRRWMGGS